MPGFSGQNKKDKKMKNPTYPNDTTGITELTFKQIQQQHNTSPHVSKQPKQAAWFSFQDLLKILKVDYIG